MPRPLVESDASQVWLGWKQSLSDHAPLEEALEVSFRDRGLLQLALTHSSYLHENPGAVPESNERLEFLGDAVLGMAVADELFRIHPGWSEGELTQARASLVQGRTLARVADRLQLGGHLHMGRGEEAGGGRQRASNLAGALESLVGALFLDRGYAAARDLVLTVLSEELAYVRRQDGLKNPKSTLQEAVQATGDSPPTYGIVEASGQDHAPEFTVEVTVGGRVLGRGSGPRKSEAEQAAATEALKALGES